MEFKHWALFDAVRSYGPHEGIDFYVKTGDNVLSCLDGTVKYTVEQENGYGKYVVVEHSDGWVTWYAHLSEIRCQPGDEVFEGSVLGLAGSSGNSTGPHLHLTVQRIGNGLSGYWIPDVVNPLDYL